MVKSNQSESTSRQAAAASKTPLPQGETEWSPDGDKPPASPQSADPAAQPSETVTTSPLHDGAQDTVAGNGSTATRTSPSPAAAPKVDPAAAGIFGAAPAFEHLAIAPKKSQYLIAVRSGSNLTPAARSLSVLDALKAMPDVEIVGSIKPSGAVAFSAGPGTNTGDVIVASTTEERGNALQAQAASTPDVIVEPNHRLVHLGILMPQLNGPIPTGLVAVANSKIQFKVTDQNGQGLEKALVVMYGSGFPVNAQTDATGTVELTLAGTIDSVQAIYIKPFADYWERFIWSPALSDSKVNTISLQPLSSFAPAGFTGFPFMGWGQKLMGLDQKTAAGLTGQGIRIGIIDSGCDNQHPALTHIHIGRDFTNLDATGNPNQQTWTTDTMSHGTHCAGVIAGNGQNGIRGFAPAAEVHILKLFEGGAFDSLIRALKYAIDNQLHVINCSLGSDQSSELVQSWMEQARQAGVAVVVAAGNSSGAVQFPASVPGVLTVSAVGQQGEFPPDTYHAQTVMPNLIGVNGIFAAKFTCFGPQVKVCGPGVAIISSVPGGGYAAWDGTSMAAPHLTGLTALIAAHHPAFADRSVPRNAAWVDKLFQTVVGAASMVGIDSNYVGAGLPSVAGAFQSATQSAAPAQSAAAAFSSQSTAGIEHIVRQAVTAALANIAGPPSW